ncbi:MAG TPA: hypothetical protein VK843_16020 [Planctomycetota bacterium]|nr:hypothetical protein [Planctomycetota bacterium]
MNRASSMASARAGLALRWCGLLLVASTSAGCVQLSFEREVRLEPVPKDALADLVPGTSDLGTALNRLGPPVFAWELPQQGTALAWGWFHSFGWRLKASDSNKSGVSVSFNYDNAMSHMHGAVLFFDRDWRLTAVREGVLSELRNSSRARPADVEAD